MNSRLLQKPRLWRSRQGVDDAAGIAWMTLERYHASQRASANAGRLLSPGWEQVTLIGPSRLIAKCRAEIAEMTAKIRGGKAHAGKTDAQSR
jgi:hypothetical protein